MWDKINDLVVFLANWLELIGFILVLFTSIKVFFINKDVKKIKARHLLNVRINEHLLSLKKTSHIIATLLVSFNVNEKNIKIEISNCLANCLSLKKKVGKTDLSSLKKLIRYSEKILRYNKEIFVVKWIKEIIKVKGLQESDIDNYYETLTLLIGEIEHFNKDLKKLTR